MSCVPAYTDNTIIYCGSLQSPFFQIPLLHYQEKMLLVNIFTAPPEPFAPIALLQAAAWGLCSVLFCSIPSAASHMPSPSIQSIYGNHSISFQLHHSIITSKIVASRRNTNKQALGPWQTMRYLHKTVLSKNGSPCTTFKEHEVKPQAVFSFTLERTLNSNSVIAQKGETKKNSYKKQKLHTIQIF